MRELSCRRVRRDLHLHLEGELEPLVSLEVASHLASCQGCTGIARKEEKLLTSLRRLPEPEPPRDIAGGVLAALRAMRPAMGPGTALKWSALSLLLGALLLPALHPQATVDLGLRLMTRLGELVDVEALAGGLVGLIPSAISSLAGLVETSRDGIPLPGVAPSLALLVLLPLLLVAAAFVAACLSGGLVFSAVRSSRLAALFRKDHTNGPFDNPPGLP